jgi:hypothetical protein
MQKGHNDGRSGKSSNPPKKKADADEYMKGYNVGAWERRNEVANRPRSDGRDVDLKTALLLGEIDVEEDDYDLEEDCEMAGDTARRVVFAMDKSTRRQDLDGHLHVEGVNISKANVCPYLGSEIPNGAELGLDMGKTYMLYRDAAELEASAPTYENKPLMITHIGVSADQPQKYYIAGTVSNVRWSAPYLKADLAVWDGEAIKDIEAETKRELSCGYRYKADMTPGVANGVKYDGIMRGITGNHVALVEAGRVGPDVLVGDRLLTPRN